MHATSESFKLIMPLRKCPWCQHTPQLYMPTDEETWVWDIRCVNTACHVQPKCKHISIRKTTKTCIPSLCDKLTHLEHYWNDGNPRPAREGKLIDLLDIVKEGKSSLSRLLEAHLAEQSTR